MTPPSGTTSPTSPTASSTRELVPLESITAGLSAVKSKDSPDTRDIEENNALARRKSRAEAASIEETNRDRRGNRVLRFRYAKAVYQYLCWYSGGCALLLILAGSSVLKLPDIVLTTIVGSTAVAAIGLVGFVVNGLFKSQG